MLVATRWAIWATACGHGVSLGLGAKLSSEVSGSCLWVG